MGGQRGGGGSVVRTRSKRGEVRMEAKSPSMDIRSKYWGLEAEVQGLGRTT